MSTSTGDPVSLAHAAGLLEAIARSESSLDAEVPLRCAVAVSLLRSARVAPVRLPPLADEPVAVATALAEAIAHLVAQPDDALSDLVLDAIGEAQAAARCARPT